MGKRRLLSGHTSAPSSTSTWSCSNPAPPARQPDVSKGSGRGSDGSRTVGFSKWTHLEEDVVQGPQEGLVLGVARLRRQHVALADLRGEADAACGLN